MAEFSTTKEIQWLPSTEDEDIVRGVVTRGRYKGCLVTIRKDRHESYAKFYLLIDSGWVKIMSAYGYDMTTDQFEDYQPLHDWFKASADVYDYTTPQTEVVFQPHQYKEDHAQDVEKQPEEPIVKEFEVGQVWRTRYAGDWRVISINDSNTWQGVNQPIKAESVTDSSRVRSFTVEGWFGATEQECSAGNLDRLVDTKKELPNFKVGQVWLSGDGERKWRVTSTTGLCIHRGVAQPIEVVSVDAEVESSAEHTVEGWFYDTEDGCPDRNLIELVEDVSGRDSL